MNEPTPTASAHYHANVRGSVSVCAPDLPLELHQMIVWIMLDPEAEKLLPAYRDLRATPKDSK